MAKMMVGAEGRVWSGYRVSSVIRTAIVTALAKQMTYLCRVLASEIHGLDRDAGGSSWWRRSSCNAGFAGSSTFFSRNSVPGIPSVISFEAERSLR